MSYKEIYELSNELYAERLELVEERIEQIIREPAIEPAFEFETKAQEEAERSLNGSWL